MADTHFWARSEDLEILGQEDSNKYNDAAFDATYDFVHAADKTIPRQCRAGSMTQIDSNIEHIYAHSTPIEYLDKISDILDGALSKVVSFDPPLQQKPLPDPPSELEYLDKLSEMLEEVSNKYSPAVPSTGLSEETLNVELLERPRAYHSSPQDSTPMCCSSSSSSTSNYPSSDEIRSRKRNYCSPRSRLSTCNNSRRHYRPNRKLQLHLKRKSLPTCSRQHLKSKNKDLHVYDVLSRIGDRAEDCGDCILSSLSAYLPFILITVFWSLFVGMIAVALKHQARSI